MRTIVTTESAELWHDFADSIRHSVTIADVYDVTEVKDSEDTILFQNAITDFQSLESDIKQQKVKTAIVFYQQCEHAIANDLMRGKSLEEAVNQWLKHTEALLQFHRQNRRAVKLFNLEQALTSPSRLTQQLKVIGVNLAIEMEAKPPASWQLLFACQYVRQEVGLKDLNERLNASSLPVADGLGITLHSSALLSDLTNKETAFKQLEIDVKSSRASFSQLEGNLAQCQSTLTQVESNFITSTTENNKLKSELLLIERDSIALQQSLNTSNSEIIKLSELNNKLQEEQQEKERTYAVIKHELEQKNAEILALKNEINTQAANFKNIAEDLHNESELLNLQLLQSQDELEKYSLDLSREKQLRAETQSELKQKNEVINQQMSQLQQQLEITNSDLLNEKQKSAEKESELTSLSKESTLALENQKQENELVCLQLAQVQEELEKNYLDLVNEKQQHIEKDGELTNQRKESTLALDIQKQENEFLNLHLAQVQDELERYYAENTNFENKLEVLKQQNQKLSSDNVNLESKIEKMQSTEKELSQKLKVLTAIEKSHSNSQAKSLQQLKIKELELARLNNQFDKAKGEIDILNHRLQQAKSEIEGIKSSVLWKSAEPVRKLARVVKKVDRKKARLQQDVGLLLTSEYFDPDWYLSTYSDVAASQLNPAEHYLTFGAKEGRFPSPKFDGNWYLKRYPDIATADINPLIHFIKFGINEGRSASPKMLTNQKSNRRG